MRKVFFPIILFLILFASCNPYGFKIYKNYEMNIEKKVSVGSNMIEKAWGDTLIYSESTQIDRGDAFTLVYLGIINDILKIKYREYYIKNYQSILKPDFDQIIKYDLSKSKIISFRTYKINILKADNEGITFVIISE